MEARAGIEPAIAGLQPTAFPLGYRAEEHGRPDAIRTRILELRTLALIHLSYGAKAFGETRTRNSALRRRASIPVGSRTHGADGGTRTHDVAYRVTNAGPSPLGYIGTIGCEPGSNRRPCPYQGRVLPTELSQHGSGTSIKCWGSWTRTNACYGQNVVPYQTWLLPIIGAGAGARTRTVRLKRPLRCRSRPAGKVGRCGESRTRYYLD